MWPGPPVKLKVGLYVDEGISEAQGRDKRQLRDSHLISVFTDAT